MIETIYDGAKIIKNKKGEEIGEVYPLKYADGEFGMFSYAKDYGYEGMDTEEEAINELHIFEGRQ